MQTFDLKLIVFILCDCSLCGSHCVKVLRVEGLFPRALHRHRRKLGRVNVTNSIALEELSYLHLDMFAIQMERGGVCPYAS